MLVLLLGPERVVYFPRDCRTWEEDGPLLDRPVSEISAEEHDGDPSEILLRPAQPAELLIYRM